MIDLKTIIARGRELAKAAPRLPYHVESRDFHNGTITDYFIVTKSGLHRGITVADSTNEKYTDFLCFAANHFETLAAEVERLGAQNAETTSVAKQLMNSMRPHPVEHPSMHAAYKRAGRHFKDPNALYWNATDEDREALAALKATEGGAKQSRRSCVQQASERKTAILSDQTQSAAMTPANRGRSGTCYECNGSGFVYVPGSHREEVCDECDGDGEIYWDDYDDD